jgi:hypothetical protein
MLSNYEADLYREVRRKPAYLWLREHGHRRNRRGVICHRPTLSAEPLLAGFLQVFDHAHECHPLRPTRRGRARRYPPVGLIHKGLGGRDLLEMNPYQG